MAGLDLGRVALARRTVRELADRLDGSVLEPGDRGWQDAVAVWNDRVVPTPALVVRPRSSGNFLGFASRAAPGRRGRGRCGPHPPPQGLAGRVTQQDIALR